MTTETMTFEAALRVLAEAEIECGGGYITAEGPHAPRAHDFNCPCKGTGKLAAFPSLIVDATIHRWDYRPAQLIQRGDRFYLPFWDTDGALEDATKLGWYVDMAICPEKGYDAIIYPDADDTLPIIGEVERPTLREALAVALAKAWEASRGKTV